GRVVSLAGRTLVLACPAAPEPERCTPDACLEPDPVCVEAEDGVACERRSGTTRVEGVCTAPTSCDDGTCNGGGSCSVEADGVRGAGDDGFGGALREGCAEGSPEDGEGGCTDDPCTPSASRTRATGAMTATATRS